MRPPIRRWLSGWLASLVLVAAVSGVVALLERHAPVSSLVVLYLFAVLPVAALWGVTFGVVVSVLSTAAFDYLFVHPRHSFTPVGSQDWIGLAVFLVTASVVSQLAARSRREALQSARLADEQAALRRVATLVARAVSPAEVFEAVIREVGLRSGADLARMERYEPDGTVTGVAGWSREHGQLAVGTRFALEGVSIAALVRETNGPVRVGSFAGASGPIAAEARELGIRSSVGCPIVVAGRLWGVIAASSMGEAPFPADTESQIADFTELVATAIANAESRAELNRIAAEQAALRRVATLVARGVGPAETFSAVAGEVRQLLGADDAAVTRLEPDGTSIVVVGDAADRDAAPAGSRRALHDFLATTTVWRTGRSARVDEDRWRSASGPVADELRRSGIRSMAASPITVEGRLWGTLGVGSRRGPLPADTEQRLVDFTELVATAIGNAESQAELVASRARIVAAADETRRRIERDLHDGAQQRLVSLSLELRLAQSAVPPDLPTLHEGIGQVADELTEVLDELREMSRGIHPAILSEGGLGPALRMLARRSPVPVELDLPAEGRLPEPIEVAGYYVVSEALTNATKHARASVVRVAVEERDGILRLSVRDDGAGGADPARGSGLTGLRDRVEALGGSIDIKSRSAEGTLIVAELPLQPD